MDSGKGARKPLADILSGRHRRRDCGSEKLIGFGRGAFIGGHGGAAKRDDVEFKIAYLEKMKALLKANSTAQAFVAAMRQAWAGLPGEAGLEALGKALYK